METLYLNHYCVFLFQSAPAKLNRSIKVTGLVTKRRLLYQENTLPIAVEQRRGNVHRRVNAKIRKRNKKAPGFKKINADDILKQLEPVVSPFLHEVLKFNLKRPKISEKMKSTSTSLLLHLGKSNYNLLRRVIPLPSETTNMRFVKNIHCKPGLNRSLLSLLNMKLKPNATNNKCFILIDEMSLKKGVSYDNKNDIIIGFEDDGVNRTEKLASYVLCVMADGIIKKWKQCISYYFSAGPMKTPQLQSLITENIKALEENNFNVMGITTDQGSNFERAFRLMGSTSSDPVIKIDEKSYFVYRDPPHLLKKCP